MQPGCLPAIHTGRHPDLFPPHACLDVPQSKEALASPIKDAWGEFHPVSILRPRTYRQPYEWKRLNRDRGSQCHKPTNSWETDTEAAAAGIVRLSQVHKRKVPRDSRQTAGPRCRAAAPE